MDPLLVFYDIHELIVQHFEYEDIFRLYKVSRHWCSLILSESRFAMRKIRLNVRESNEDEVMNMLQNKTTEINRDLLDILSTSRKYQNIAVHVDHGWDFIDQLVRNLATSLVDVEVSSDIFLENLKIPMLRYLKLDNPLLEGLAACTEKLKRLVVTVSGRELWQKRESPLAVKNALKANDNLEVLEIDEVLTEVIFNSDLTSLVKLFKLCHFSLTCNGSFDENKFTNIRNFLGGQARLEHLSIEYPDPHTLQWIYASLSHLKSLKLKFHFETLNPRELHLSASESITKLDLDITANWQYSMNIKWALRTFITTLPKLENFIIRMPSPLEHDDFRFLLFNARKLRLFIQNVEEEGLHTYREIYEQMRQDHESISEFVEFNTPTQSV